MMDEMAPIKEARREPARIAAQIELLRAERERYAALAVDVGEAISRLVAVWQQLHGATMDLAPPSPVPPLSPPATEHQPLSQPAAAATPPGADAAAMGDVQRGPGADVAVSRLTLAISALPGLAPLFEVERALAQSPSVASCAVGSLRRGLAILELALRRPTAPLVVAGEMLSAPARMLVVESVDDQRIVARFTPHQ